MRVHVFPEIHDSEDNLKLRFRLGKAKEFVKSFFGTPLTLTLGLKPGSIYPKNLQMEQVVCLVLCHGLRGGLVLTTR
jgi:hypothetical protein